MFKRNVLKKRIGEVRAQNVSIAHECVCEHARQCWRMSRFVLRQKFRGDHKVRDVFSVRHVIVSVRATSTAFKKKTKKHSVLPLSPSVQTSPHTNDSAGPRLGRIPGHADLPEETQVPSTSSGVRPHQPRDNPDRLTLWIDTPLPIRTFTVSPRVSRETSYARRGKGGKKNLRETRTNTRELRFVRSRPRKPFHGPAGDHVEPRTQEPPAGKLLAEHAVRDHVVGQLRGHARSRAGKDGPVGHDPPVVGHHVRHHKVHTHLS